MIMLDQENCSQSASKRRKPAEPEEDQPTKLDNNVESNKGSANIESGTPTVISSNVVNDELSFSKNRVENRFDVACKVSLNDVACCSSSTVTKNENENCDQIRDGIQVNTDSKETTSEKADQCRALRNYKSRNYRNRFTLCTSSSDGDDDVSAANDTVQKLSANVSSASSSRKGASQISTAVENIANSSAAEIGDLLSIENNRSDGANTNSVPIESTVEVVFNSMVDEENSSNEVTTKNVVTESGTGAATALIGNRGNRRKYRNRWAYVSSPSSSLTDEPMQDTTNAKVTEENIVFASSSKSNELARNDDDDTPKSSNISIIPSSERSSTISTKNKNGNSHQTVDSTQINTDSKETTSEKSDECRARRNYKSRNYRNRFTLCTSSSNDDDDDEAEGAANDTVKNPSANVSSTSSSTEGPSQKSTVTENIALSSTTESADLVSIPNNCSESANTNNVPTESAVEVSRNAIIDQENATTANDATTNNTESIAPAGTNMTSRGNRRSGRGNRRNYRNRWAYVSSPSSSSTDEPMQDSTNAEEADNAARVSSPESNDLASNDDDAPESSDVSLISSPDIPGVFHRHLFSSSSNNDTSNTDEVMNESMAEEANNEQAEALHDVLNKPKPTYTWNSTYELKRREHGLSGNGRYSLRNGVSTGFNARFYASRHVVERMKFLHPLRKHTGCVNCLNFNRSGNLLCTGSDDTQVVVWDWAQKKVKHSYKSGHTANIFQTKFIENGNACLDVISAGRDGEVRRAIIPTSGGKISTTRLYKHRGPVHKLVVCPQSPSEIISVGEDGYIRHHDLRKETEASDMLKIVKVNNKKIRLFSISHHPFNAEIVVCGCDRFVRIYDKRNMSDTVHEMCPEHLLETTIPQVTCSVYNSNGTEILSSYSDDHIYLFNNKLYKKGDYMHRYRGHYNNKTIKGVNFFGPNSEYVISGSDCSNIFFWDKNTEAILNCMPGDTLGVVNCLEPHPFIPILATSGLDHNVKIWAPHSETYPPDLSKLGDRVKRNLRRSVLEEANEIDNRQFNYFIRQFLSNSYARRRASQSENVAGSQTLSSSSSSSDDDDDDDDYPQIEGVNCRTQ